MASHKLKSPFCFPLQCLESERLRIVPFIYDKHAPLLVNDSKEHPEIFSYITHGPFSKLTEFEAFYNSKFLHSEGNTLFAIEVKEQQSSEDQKVKHQFAGMIGYQNADLVNLCIEIGFILVLPAFQGSFVAKSAVAILLCYALDPPSQGLGLRRCQWQAHADNVASIRLAKRLHFSYEGTLRFQRVMPINKVGNGVDTTSMPNFSGKVVGPSRDTVMYAHYCDCWSEKRPLVRMFLPE